jgi:hypothetical protein
MRLRTSSLVLAGVLVASGGALAVASTETPAPGATTVTAADPTPTEEATGTGTPAPPGQAKKEDKDKTGEHPGRGPGGQGRGPDATGPAAYGLCEAWANQEDPAAKAERVPPFRNLAAAAGGVDKVDEYCAALPEREPDDDD